MNEDWRYDDGKLHERQIALMCLIRNKIDINREAYEFCNYFVSNGLFNGELPTEDNLMEDRLKQFGGDVSAMVSEKLMKRGLSKWQILNEREPHDKENYRKKTIKNAKKHPNWYTPEEIQYIKIMKRALKKD